MKSFIIIILAVAGLSGAILIMNYLKENSTENNAQNIVENNSVENDNDQEVKFEDDHEHDHSVEIEGSEVRTLTVQEVADLWEIDSEELLSRIIQEFNFQGNYTTETVLEDMREAEYKFSPAIIKDLAEEIKQGP